MVCIFIFHCVTVQAENRDYFMGRARVRDFRTLRSLVRFLIQTTSVKIPYKGPAHEVIYLFHTYFVNISSLYLEKMASELRNKGQLKPNTLKNTSFVGLYKCCELKY